MVKAIQKSYYKENELPQELKVIKEKLQEMLRSNKINKIKSIETAKNRLIKKKKSTETIKLNGIPFSERVTIDGSKFSSNDPLDHLNISLTFLKNNDYTNAIFYLSRAAQTKDKKDISIEYIEKFMDISILIQEIHKDRLFTEQEITYRAAFSVVLSYISFSVRNFIKEQTQTKDTQQLKNKEFEIIKQELKNTDNFLLLQLEDIIKNTDKENTKFLELAHHLYDRFMLDSPEIDPLLSSIIIDNIQKRASAPNRLEIIKAKMKQKREIKEVPPFTF